MCLADVARSLDASIDLNILSRSLFFLAHADIASMWPEQKDIVEIVKFLAKRPIVRIMRLIMSRAITTTRRSANPLAFLATFRFLCCQTVTF